MILRYTFPPVALSMRGAAASAIVFTALAPIASRQSTRMWVMTIGPLSVDITRTSTSRAPPPYFTSMGSFELQRSIISSFFSNIADLASSGSATPVNWICPIITGSVLDVVNPPLWRAIFAAFDAAATTEGSSVAIGMR